MLPAKAAQNLNVLKSRAAIHEFAQTFVFKLVFCQDAYYAFLCTFNFPLRCYVDIILYLVIT